MISNTCSPYIIQGSSDNSPALHDITIAVKKKFKSPDMGTAASLYLQFVPDYIIFFVLFQDIFDEIYIVNSILIVSNKLLLQPCDSNLFKLLLQVLVDTHPCPGRYFFHLHKLFHINYAAGGGEFNAVNFSLPLQFGFVGFRLSVCLTEV